MKYPNTPLSDNELERLDEILSKCADQQPEDSFCIGSISQLDGFLTAVVSSPNVILPGVWIKRLFGGEDLPFPDEQAFQECIDLIFRHYNSIVRSLNIAPENNPFSPIFDYLEYQDGTDGEFCLVDEWCSGYLLGAEMSDWPDISEVREQLFIIEENAIRTTMLLESQQEITAAMLKADYSDEVITAVLHLHLYGRQQTEKELTRQTQSKHKKAWTKSKQATRTEQKNNKRRLH